MSYFFNKDKKKLIFADKTPLEITPLGKADIILSPIFYWSKFEKLEVKYAYQAKSYAASIFEGNIPRGNYIYKVFKHEDGFIFFAYNSSEILKKLEKLNIKSSNIKNVYFAQTEFCDIKYPVAINHLEALCKSEEMVVKMPLRFFEQTNSIENFLQNHKLSNNAFQISKVEGFLEKKEINLLSIAVILLIFAFTYEFLSLKNTISSQKKQVANLIEKYNLPRTQIQRNSIIKRFSAEVKEQQNLRQKYYDIINLPLLQNEYITKLYMKDKKINLEVKTSSNQSISKINQYLQKHFIVQSQSDANSILKVKLAYE